MNFAIVAHLRAQRRYFQAEIEHFPVSFPRPGFIPPVSFPRFAEIAFATPITFSSVSTMILMHSNSPPEGLKKKMYESLILGETS